MAGEEVGKPSDNPNERTEKKLDKTSKETAEASVIGGQQQDARRHQQQYRQAMESNPNKSEGSMNQLAEKDGFKPADDGSFQLLEAIAGTNEKRIVAERPKPEKSKAANNEISDNDNEHEASPGVADASLKDVSEFARQIAKNNKISDPAARLEQGSRIDLRPFQKTELARDLKDLQGEIPAADEVAMTHEAIRTVTVKKGDTLWGISKALLAKNATGDDIKKLVDKIGKDNRLAAPDKIYPGQRLAITGLSDKVKRRVEPTPMPEPRPEPSPEPHPEPSPEPQPESAPADASPDTEKEADRPLNLPDALPRYAELLKVAKDHGINFESFKYNLELIEQREARGDLDYKEIEKTYKQVERLLKTKSTASVTDMQQAILAQQIIAQTANPATVCQGAHNTCNVTVDETKLYRHNPSDAARMVTDLALTGKYTAGDGTRLDMTQTFTGPDGKPITMSITPKSEAGTKVPVDDGKRSYASELFQVCAVNLHYAKNGGTTHYVQPEYNKRHPKDSEEKLYKPDGTIEDSPELSAGAIVDIYNSIIGPTKMLERMSKGLDTRFAIKNTTLGSEQGVISVSSQKGLEQALENARANHAFPLIIQAHTANEPFWTDSGGGEAGGAGGNTGGWHVVTITDYQPATDKTPALVTIDNQWNQAADKTDMIFAISSKEMYRATLPPEQNLKELQKEAQQMKQDGRSDAALEFDILHLTRLTEIAGLKQQAKTKGLKEPTNFDSADYNKKVRDLVKQQTERWNQEREAGTIDQSEEFRGIGKLAKIVNLMSQDARIQYAHDLAQDALITQDEYMQYLFSAAISDIKTGKDMSPTFSKLKAELPEDEQLTLMNAMISYIAKHPPAS